jgi:hypothetical protein
MRRVYYALISVSEEKFPRKMNEQDTEKAIFQAFSNLKDAGITLVAICFRGCDDTDEKKK